MSSWLGLSIAESNNSCSKVPQFTCLSSVKPPKYAHFALSNKTRTRKDRTKDQTSILLCTELYLSFAQLKPSSEGKTFSSSTGGSSLESLTLGVFTRDWVDCLLTRFAPLTTCLVPLTTSTLLVDGVFLFITSLAGTILTARPLVTNFEGTDSVCFIFTSNL